VIFPGQSICSTKWQGEDFISQQSFVEDNVASIYEADAYLKVLDKFERGITSRPELYTKGYCQIVSRCSIVSWSK
jgi:hypothetical protein